jgi:hypothetical protein
MPVLNEDTFTLVCLVEQNEAPYSDCYRIASQALERNPPRGKVELGIGRIAAAARAELAGILRNVLQYSDDRAVQQHLSQASIDWHDVAREFIADVLFAEPAEQPPYNKHGGET